MAAEKKKPGPKATKKSREKPDYQHRHSFPVTILGPNGQAKIVKAKAIVKTPRQGANIIVMPEHVKLAMENDACGNSSMCTMANAVAANASEFSHKVTGTIDFHGMTCFVVSKEDKHGLPTECYRYMHNSDVPKLNDTPGGMEFMLERMASEGALEVALRPRVRRFYEKKGGTGKYDGTRSSRARSTADARRHMVAMRGGSPELLARQREAMNKRQASALKRVREQLANEKVEEGDDD